MVLETVNTTAVKSLKNLSRLGFAGVYRYPFVSEHLQKSVDDLTHPYAFIQKLHLSQDVLHHMRHLIGKHVHLRTQEKLKRLEKWKGDVRQAMKYPDHILNLFGNVAVEVSAVNEVALD